MSDREYPEYLEIAEDLAVLDAKFSRFMAEPREGKAPPQLSGLLSRLNDLNRDLLAIKTTIENRTEGLTREEQEKFLNIIRNIRDCKREFIKFFESNDASC